MKHRELWGITPGIWDRAQTFRAVRHALQVGVSRVILRELQLSWAHQISLYASILDSGISAERVLLRLHPSAPTPPDGWSVHLSIGAPRPPGPRPFVSAAAHAISELRTDVDCVLASPFAAPQSKPSTRPPLHTSGLAHIIAAAERPVLALGGVTATNAAEALEAGAAGVAAIHGVFLAPPTEQRDLLLAVRGGLRAVPR